MADTDSTPEVPKDDSPTPAGTDPDVTKAAEPVEVSPDAPEEKTPAKAEPKAAPKAKTEHKRSTTSHAKAEAKEEPAPKTEHKRSAPAKAEEESSFELTLPTQALQVRIQRALGRHGRYSGPANGKFDERSLKGVQASLPSHSLETADGNLDEKDAKSLQRFAKKHGYYAGPINGHLDANSWTGFAVALERTK